MGPPIVRSSHFVGPQQRQEGWQNLPLCVCPIRKENLSLKVFPLGHVVGTHHTTLSCKGGWESEDLVGGWRQVGSRGREVQEVRMAIDQINHSQPHITS